MLNETMTALAAAGGTAFAQAAGTHWYDRPRSITARLLGRGDAERERAVAQQLDSTVAGLETADDPEAVAGRIRQEAAIWFGSLLMNLDDAAREEAAGQLRELIRLAEEATAAAPSGDHIEFSGDFKAPVLGKGTQNITYRRAPRR
ncbi:hypothetical protein AB0F13_12295 [Streptomyces sp. NPDC026206]|uniref:hypothetical protein n=1 Tax=Streptomyces sp. NPDC026206 TaxID=3157089 RepID=UPI0033C40A54